MTQTSNDPDRSEQKAIRFPSGDHAGQPSYRGLRVIRRTLDPSAFMT
jgi:hypothetical protein